MRILFVFALAFLSVSGMAQNNEALKVDMIGPYALGSMLADLQKLPDFQQDSLRSRPEEGIIVGKIIAKNVFGKMTIQRLHFHNNRLVKVNIIFADPKVSEEEAKALVVNQWGEPGEKIKVSDNMRYVWKGTLGMIMISDADGGRQMITLLDGMIVIL